MKKLILCSMLLGVTACSHDDEDRAEVARDRRVATAGDERPARADRDGDRDRDRDVQADARREGEEADADTGVTASDQSNEESDLTITQLIRQAVVADDRLSFSAKNVTIVTQAGVVTLRGDVNAEERNVIAGIAQRVNGVRRLDNQLHVDAD